MAVGRYRPAGGRSGGRAAARCDESALTSSLRFYLPPSRRIALPAFVSVLCGALPACRADSPPNPVKAVFAEAPRTAESGAPVAFRFPADGGQARLYRLPDLDEVSWRFDAGPRGARRLIGFASDDDRIYALTDSAHLTALDLATGRTRTVDTNVAAAALGPTGRAYLVHTDGSVAEVERRAAVPWADTLPSVPTVVWGAARGRLLAVVPDDIGPTLFMVAKEQPAVRQRLRQGPVAASKWGDLVAVAADSGLATYVPADPERAAFLPLAPRPRLVAFSPSAHRIYVVLGASTLVTIERFQLVELRRFALPGRVGELRIDPLGRYLLARPETGDSLWIVDASNANLLATVPGEWDPDLPTVAPDGTFVLRRGPDVVTLSQRDLTLVASAPAPQGDRWFLTAWDPRRPALEVASDTTPSPEQPGQILYVQVSSSRNPAWAEDLAQKLREAGVSASVLPDSIDELYRVVLGPYTTREEAEEIGRKLGRPFWILLREPEIPIP